MADVVLMLMRLRILARCSRSFGTTALFSSAHLLRSGWCKDSMDTLVELALIPSSLRSMLLERGSVRGCTDHFNDMAFHGIIVLHVGTPNPREAVHSRDISGDQTVQ